MADDNLNEDGKLKAVKKKDVAFSPEQMELIQGMLDGVRNENRTSRPDAISMYNMRDPKTIESVNIKRINGKFVMDFKNHQKDAFKKKPLYCVYKLDGSRGGAPTREPFVTLLLQEDEGSEVEEVEMMLVDYVTMGKRDQYQAKVVNIDLEEKIEQHGILGARGEYAGEVDDKGKPISTTKVLAETKRQIRTFWVELPGFSKPVAFSGEPNGPLA